MTRFIGNMKNELWEENLPEKFYNVFLAFVFEIVTAISKIHTSPIAEAVTFTLIITTIVGATTICVK